MKQNFKKNKLLYVVAGAMFLIAFLFLSGCKKNPPKPLKDFNQVNVVANDDKYHPARVDENFINGWGLSFSPTGIIWASAEGTGLSEVWRNDGSVVFPAVTIPGATDDAMGGHPSGQVFNGSTDFKLPNGNPARFIFAGLDGIISGWNGGPAAVVAINDSKKGDVYTGLALASMEGANYLYAANFSKKKIAVYDKDWNEVKMSFKDPQLPAGFSPFNIQNVEGKLYVMYAKVGNDGDEQKGHGLGFVDIYNANGSLVKRFASAGELNVPWGVAKAPADFWPEGTEIMDGILVGNFGDGRINVYDQSGHFIGPLRSTGKPIVIEGLWGISFAPTTATATDPGWLFFAAGPDDEEDGLFGYITK